MKFNKILREQLGAQHTRNAFSDAKTSMDTIKARMDSMEQENAELKKENETLKQNIEQIKAMQTTVPQKDTSKIHKIAPYSPTSSLPQAVPSA